MATAPEAQAADLIAALDAENEPRSGRMGKVARYLAGDHDLPYAPQGAKEEFRTLARKAITNWLPLVSDTFAKVLWVDGYRAANASGNADPWDLWQANGLDARQSIMHRGALEYGTAYTLVLPGRPDPRIRPLAPQRTFAVYEDDDDEWPVLGVYRKGRALDGSTLYEMLDNRHLWTLRVPKDGGKPALEATEEHGLGVTPLVRFRSRLDGPSVGVIAPLINLQDRINEAVFSLLIALQYASFRQRWATGMAIPRDDRETLEDGTPNPNYGKPVEAFSAAVNRLWVTDNPEAKFGDFAQTDVSGHLNAYESAVRTMAAIAQTSPHALMGDLVNLSADALAASEATTQRKTSEYETLFGESWEQVLRLGAAARGDRAGASDTQAQVRWRDTEARALASTVDALGKMAQMLMIPVEGLWERIPGVTDTDVQAWKALAAKATDGDGMKALANALTANAATPTTGQAYTAETPPPAAAGTPAPPV